MVWYFIGVYYGCAHSWNIFQHSERNFVSPRGHVISSIYLIIFANLFRLIYFMLCFIIWLRLQMTMHSGWKLIDTMESSSIWYLQVISWERLPIRSMDLFKMNEGWNQFLIQLKYPSEFWLGFLLFRQKCLLKTERGGVQTWTSNYSMERLFILVWS